MDWPSVHLLVSFLSHFFKKKPIRIVEQSTIVIFTIVWTYLLFTKEKKTVQKVIKVWVCQYLCTEKFCLEYKIPCILPSRQIEKLFFSEEGTWYIISVFQLAESYFLKKEKRLKLLHISNKVFPYHPILQVLLSEKKWSMKLACLCAQTTTRDPSASCSVKCS